MILKKSAFLDVKVLAACLWALPLGAVAASNPVTSTIPDTAPDTLTAAAQASQGGASSPLYGTAAKAGGPQSLTMGASTSMPEVTVIGRSELVWSENTKLDASRDQNLLPKLGSTEYAMGQAALQALPQGQDTPIDKVLLQAPGVSYDSAISNPDFHVRNEYANVQYRVNGIQLPDGVSALGPVLETGFIGNLNLLDGALPAQYGLRTAGVVDITTKTEFEPGGQLSFYAGTWGTLSPSFELGGVTGKTQYFLTGRYLQSQQGLENAMPTPNPIHDSTTQEKSFGYSSTLLGDHARLTVMAGSFDGQFQIPDVSGQEPLGDFGPGDLSSTRLNENEYDQFYFGMLTLQTHLDRLDTQLSVYSRYASIDFIPDVYDDLAFLDVASKVDRRSELYGAQFDSAERLGRTQTLRAGLSLSVEGTQVDDLSTVLPLDSMGDPLPDPETLDDATDRLGWNAGGYVQDEWRVLEDLTLNAGLRFDWMDQFVTADQLSPRVALVYTPGGGATLHAGISRYFTPPMQAQSTPNNLALFQNTTQAPAGTLEDAVQPERAWYYDVGLDEKPFSCLGTGLDAYYKASTDTLDDGQFGQAVVLDQFNYARGFSEGAEMKADYEAAGFRVYANGSYEVTEVEDVVSSEYLFDPGDLAYMADHYVGSSDAQTVSASWGASYRWKGLLAGFDGMYGSGLPSGFDQNSPAYTQWNATAAWTFRPKRGWDPLTLRVSVINAFDLSYVLRAAGGVGEFAPQYGPRRGLFTELTQRF